MIKELFIAIVLGAILGFGVTSGFYTITKSNKTTTISPTPTIIVSSTIDESTPVQETNSNLNIDSPLNESITTESKINIKGTSKPNNILIINTPLDTYNLTVDETGSFSIEIELESGANTIKISAIDSDNNQTNSELLITYSSAKF